MERIPYGNYTEEFREEAVKLVIESGLSIQEAGRRLSLSASTLGNWMKVFKAGKLGNVGKTHRELSDKDMEIHQLRRELAQVKKENEAELLSEIRELSVREIDKLVKAKLRAAKMCDRLKNIAGGDAAGGVTGKADAAAGYAAGKAGAAGDVATGDAATNGSAVCDTVTTDAKVYSAADTPGEATAVSSEKAPMLFCR